VSEHIVSGTITITASAYEVWWPTAELRFRQTPETTTRPAVLEQAWKSYTGRTEWRAVPTVVLPDPTTTGSAG
jgi:hypothetical protein